MHPFKRLVFGAAGALGYHVGLRPPKAEGLRDHLAILLERLEVNCALDVGAYRGRFGRMLRDLGYRGRIVSFEPVASNLAALREESAGDPNWIVIGCALGPSDGHAPIHAMRQSSLHSFLTPSAYGKAHFPGQLDIVENPMVEVRTLDGVLGQCVDGIDGPRMLLKLDTQGYDSEVLRGAETCLDSVRILLSEVSVQPIYEGMVDYTDFIGRMKVRGFDLSGLFPVTLDRAFRLIEMDCVMIRAEGP